MRCIFGLATAGLVILGGTAAADAQPPGYAPDPSVAQAVVDPPPWPPRPMPLPHPLPPRPNIDPPDPSDPRPPWGQPTPPRPIPPRPIPLPPPPQPMPPIVVPPWGPTAGGPYAKRLTLTFSYRGRTRTVRLGCTPVYGAHPNGPQACALLSRAQGDPAYIRLPWTACPRHYDPVTVSATGVWNGRYIRYQRTFSNQCELRAATGVIFYY